MKPLTKKDHPKLYDIVTYNLFKELTNNNISLLLTLNRKNIHITFINNEYLELKNENFKYSLKFKDLLNSTLKPEDNLKLSLYMNIFISENSLESNNTVYKKYTDKFEYVLSTEDKSNYFFQKYNKKGELVVIKELATLGSYKKLELYTFIEKLIKE